jgi:hypothetical protein
MQPHETRRTRLTVLELEELPSGEWRATQTGVNREGRGETAAAAAAAYCRRVAGDEDQETGEP